MGLLQAQWTIRKEPGARPGSPLSSPAAPVSPVWQEKGPEVMVWRRSLRITRCRGSWGSIGNQGCSSLGFSSGSRRASGHRSKASSGRGAPALQTGRQMRNEEDALYGHQLPGLLQSGLASRLSRAPVCFLLGWSAQSDEGSTASIPGEASSDGKGPAVRGEVSA